MANGRYNVAIGLLGLAWFMVLGFVLIYARDVAPGRAQWITEAASGKHFETTLAHVHGALFSTLNIAIGLTLARTSAADTQRRIIAWLALGGLLMPIGILAEVIFGLPPVLVIVGALSIMTALLWLGITWLRAAPRASSLS